MQQSSVTEFGELEGALGPLLAQAGQGTALGLHTLAGGANNRLFRVDMGAGSVLVKQYFRHPDEQQDRLAREFAFMSFAWQVGIRSIPQPLACDREAGIGLYEFVAGRPLAPEEISWKRVEEAIGFFEALNRYQPEPGAQRLGDAAEAHFSISGHLAGVGARLSRLQLIEPSTAMEVEALDLVTGRLAPVWERIVAVTAREFGKAAEDELSPADRCLSPSDFGFHNAILQPDGSLRFIDFEYAGWDDPAKLVCDFFCQPRLPVGDEHRSGFVARIASGAAHSDLQRRVELLMPVYRFKWCCIMLNEFLPVSAARRRFAAGAGSQSDRRAEQLEQARLALDNLLLTLGRA